MNHVASIKILFMKLNDKLMLGFQENQSFFAHTVKDLSILMYNAHDLLEA